MKKKQPATETWDLSWQDLAAVLDSDLDLVSQEGIETLEKVLVEMIVAAGRFDERIAALHEWTKAFGSKFLGEGLQTHDELEQLLAADGWCHPAEVIDEDPEEIDYARLIRGAAAMAAKADDPDPILAVQRRLEAAAAANDASRKLFETFIVHLLELEPPAARERLDRLSAHYYYRSHRPGGKLAAGRQG